MSNAAIKILLLLLLIGFSHVTSCADTINDAVHRGDITEVRRMLRADRRLARYHSADHTSPLHWAAWDGRADIALLLIEAGADLDDRRAYDGGTPLWLATWQGHDDVVKLLVQHGADPEIRSNDGNTPFHKAVATGHFDSVERFIIAGQNVDTQNSQGDTPLCVAAEYGRLDAAQCLIGNGANIHHRNKQNQTPLDLAIAGKHADIAAVIRAHQEALDERAALDLVRKASPTAFRTGYLNWIGPQSREQRVYDGEFQDDVVGKEWSTRALPGAQQAPLHISVTPKGVHRFLGEFGSQAVRLTLTQLPPHTEASINFHLYIIRTWDGNDLRFGPDVFTLSVADGPILLRTTFDNPIYPERMLCTKQAYPGEYAGDFHRPQSGAIEVDTLGFTLPAYPDYGVMDATYELSYTFSHHAGTLALDFAAQGLEALDNESWGITHVQVSVAGAQPHPTPSLTRNSIPTPARTVHVASHLTVRRSSPSKPRATLHRSVPVVKKPAGSHPPAARLHPKERPPEP